MGVAWPELAVASQCTGCGACVAACSFGALRMKEDEDGYLRPSVSSDACRSCGRCTASCPILHPCSRCADGASYFAARLKDAASLEGVSSGGAFWALACATIGEGGVVYGAVQDPIGCVWHDRAETVESARRFCRSKYLPSEASAAYPRVREDLASGRTVLFSGTGCQVAGLKAFLGRPEPGLVTCEVICHGIPSTRVWRSYRAEKERSAGKAMEHLVFRDKSRGWKSPQYRIVYSDGSEELEPLKENPFHRAYLKGLMNRPSCAQCPTASLPRVADLSLADFWRYEGSLAMTGPGHAGGVSLVAVNSPTGNGLWSRASCYLDWESATAEAALASCRHLSRPPLESPDRRAFLDVVCSIGFDEALRGIKSVGKRKKPLLVRLAKRLLRLVRGASVRTSPRISAMEDAFLLLAKKGVSVWYCNRIGKEKCPGWRYSDSAERRILEKATFPALSQDIDRHEDVFRELLGEKYSRAYVEDLARIPQIVRTGGRSRHADCRGRCVNVIGGLRVTVGQPAEWKRTVHVYGRCGAFGYAVEDAETLPSQLQRAFVSAGQTAVRVVNHGLWGGDDETVDSNFLQDLSAFAPGDVVLFYRKHLSPPLMARWEKRYGVRYLDITHAWHEYPEAKGCFYDRPGHMTAIGYAHVAELISREMLRESFRGRDVSPSRLKRLRTRHLAAYEKRWIGGDFDASVDRYVESVRTALPPLAPGRTAGAIVMNCNPFTNGHRYLVERAAAEVDRLYVFVVEEDRSVFRFEERLEMVKAGVADIANVVVFPSGRFMISALTFPEYFLKDYVKERAFDVSSDLRTFCERIAPPLGISVRFAGTEPSDPVTAAYNVGMARILPQYGIRFFEVPRLEHGDGKVVNATEVRRLLSAGDWVSLEDLVPATTLAILKAHAARGGAGC